MPQAETRRLLRVLFLWVGPMPAGSAIRQAILLFLRKYIIAKNHLLVERGKTVQSRSLTC